MTDKLRTIFGFLLKFSVSGALVAVLFTMIDFSEASRIAAGSNLLLLAAAAAVFAASNLLGALQWHLLMRSLNLEIRFSDSVVHYFIGLFFNNFLPSSMGGDPVKIYNIAREKHAVESVAAATLVDRMLGLLALSFLAVVASPFAAARIDRPELALVAPVFFGLLLAAFSIIAMPGSSRIFQPITRLIYATRPGARLKKAVADTRALMNPASLAGLFLLSFGIQTLRVGVHFIVARALGLNELHFTSCLVVVPVLGILIMLPSINGIGIRETGGAVLFSRWLTPAAAGTMQTATWLVGVAVSLAGGLFYLTRRRRAAAEAVRRDQGAASTFR